VAARGEADFTKTKTMRLASEPIGKDLYRQVHRVTFTEKSGKLIDVITVSSASREECSMGEVDAFLVSKQPGRRVTTGAAETRASRSL
jgi:hypothetical protein